MAQDEGAVGMVDPAAPSEGGDGAVDSAAVAESERLTGGDSANITRDVTPNGTVIEYEAKPKRLYRVNGVEVPSVTTVLDVLKADGLVWWGQSKGVQGVIDLFDLGALTAGLNWTSDKQFIAIPQGEDEIPANEPAITELLKRHKLTVNHRLDQASDRGVNVHDALENWARIRLVPDVNLFPEEERGYVDGLVSFLEDLGQDAEPERIEVMVGSAEHGFAGRFDLVLVVYSPFEYAARCYPKRADKVEVIQPGRYLLDLKTSKRTYDKHFLQLAAYELAAVECGYPATDGQAVIHVTADGKYELVFSDAKPEQFLAIKSAYDALEEL